MDQHRQSLLLDPDPALSSAPLSSDQVVVAPHAEPVWVASIVSGFSAYPRLILAVAVVVVVMLALSIVSIILLIQTKAECDEWKQPSSVPCGAGSHDLSSLTNFDLPPYQVTQSGVTYVYYLHTCGRLDTSSCLPQFPSSQACMFASNLNTVYDIADYTGSNGGGTWSEWEQGVLYASATGGSCPDNTQQQLSLKVWYTCDQSAASAFISEVFSGLGVQCEKNFRVMTNLVC